MCGVLQLRPYVDWRSVGVEEPALDPRALWERTFARDLRDKLSHMNDSHAAAPLAALRRAHLAGWGIDTDPSEPSDPTEAISAAPTSRTAHTLHTLLSLQGQQGQQGQQGRATAEALQTHPLDSLSADEADLFDAAAGRPIGQRRSGKPAASEPLRPLDRPQKMGPVEPRKRERPKRR